MARALRWPWAPVLLFGLASACAPARPKPASAPEPARQNPPDERAAIPRPTPVRRETKFAPPQQSEEEESRESNRANEPDLLHSDPGITLDGQPFPARHVYDPKFPEPRRLRFVSSEARADGDGTAERPWGNLQRALCLLAPGDRLIVLSGIYVGSFAVSGGCRDGTAEAPIQVWAHHSFFRPSGEAPVLSIDRAHWQFWEVQIALTDSRAPGLVISGAGAHDIAVDQTHIYEGEGAAVVVGAGASAVTISNCHIHQSAGVRIEAGASRVTIVSSHIHHNKGDSLRVAGAEVAILGNRFHNDGGRGLVLEEGCRDAKVSDNRYSNYRPRQGSGGEAVVVAGCRGVRFEGNAVLEASTGVSVRAGERVDLFRNDFENRLTEEAVALSVEGGRQVRFANGVVSQYAHAVRVRGARLSAGDVVVANSLFLGPAAAVEVDSPSAVVFSHNVFGTSAREALPAWMVSCRVVPGAALEGQDLARIIGFSPVDAGAVLDGLGYRGNAPDIGVAEH